MQLSENFSLEELTITQHRHVSNTPTPDALEHLKLTAAMLEQVRALLGGKPIIVSSGFRSMQLNTLVGGQPNSAHLRGYAADFICPQFGTPEEVCKAIRASDMKFDQLIWEGTWTHLSCDPKMRRQVLTMQGGRYSVGLPA